MEAIGAEQETVPGLGLAGQRAGLHLHSILVPHGLAEHVPLGVTDGLLRGDDALGHHTRDLGVVLGQLLELPAPEQVRPAIPDMAQENLLPQQQQGGHGRPHALEVRGLKGAIEDLLVRGLNGLSQPRLRVLRGAGEVALAHCPHGDTAGVIPSSHPPHSVGHDDEPPVLLEAQVIIGFVIGKVVLILAPHLAHIAMVAQADAIAHLHGLLPSPRTPIRRACRKTSSGSPRFGSHCHGARGTH